MIPARLGARRFPNKPLALIRGEPMLVHVLRRALEAELGPVVLAAAERELCELAQNAFPRAHRTGQLRTILTDPALPSGSDRIWQAYQRDINEPYDVLLNLQGDLPTLDAATIQRVAHALVQDQAWDITTAVAPFQTPEQATNPDCVKAVCAFPDLSDFSELPGTAARRARGSRRLETARVLYFSRAPVPWGQGPLWHHIGLYAYRREILRQFTALPPSELEKREKLEQLRALDQGWRIGAVRTPSAPPGVDKPEHIAEIETILASR